MAAKYSEVKEDAEAPFNAEEPQQWAPHEKCIGAGQFEWQQLKDWTEAEKELWRSGDMTAKIGLGQVTIRLPIRDPFSAIAIMYGFLPYLVPISWIIWVLFGLATDGHARFFPLYGICISVGFAAINELIVKQICKLILPARIAMRPPESVCKHPGMPSGHVMNGYTLMTWCLLEAGMGNHIHYIWLLIILAIMAPVPLARVYNNDHTWPQVTASVVIATGMGMLAFAIRTAYFAGHWDPFDATGPR